MTKAPFLILGIGLASMLASCSTNDRLLGAQQKFRGGNFGGAASTLAGQAVKEPINSRDAVILKLEAGSMSTLAGRSSEGLELLKSADKAIEAANQRPLVQLGREAGALVTNLNAIPYIPPPSNQIMGASYLALSFANQGMLTEARSAVKLAKNRQSDAFAKYQKEIDREKQAMTQARAASQVPFSIDESKISGVTSTIEADVKQYSSYASHSVPYAELISGLLLGAGEGAEPDRARESFSRALAVAPSNSALRQAAGGSVNGRVHVIIEEGVAPSLDQAVMHLPLKINDKMIVFSAAYPKFIVHPHHGDTSIVAGGQSTQADLVCDFDRIAGDEFRRRLPGIISRTTAASVTKAAMSYAAQEALAQRNSNAALVAGLVGAAYNIATAQADRRSWACLPKRVSYANLQMPANRIVQVGGRQIELPKANTVILRVRQVAGQQAAEITVL
jgi:hypothetical protein